MVRLDKDIAVIGAVGELLATGKEPVLNPAVICEYTRMLESRSGLAVLHGFTEEEMDRFLRDSPFFVPEVHGGTAAYRLAGHPAGTASTEEDTVRTMRKMLDAYDPRLNYPMELLEDMRLIPALEGRS